MAAPQAAEHRHTDTVAALRMRTPRAGSSGWQERRRARQRQGSQWAEKPDKAHAQEYEQSQPGWIWRLAPPGADGLAGAVIGTGTWRAGPMEG